MSHSKSPIRKIGFLIGWEATDEDDITKREQDDLSCTVTIVCNFLITILTPFYYKLFWKQRKLGVFKLGQRIMNQIALVSILPSIFCICNIIFFISEVVLISDIPFTKNSNSTRKAMSVIMMIMKPLCAYILYWSCRIFQYYVILFQTLLTCFIILLALQRFVLIFLPEKLHCLVKPMALRIYTIVIWIICTLHGLLIFFILLGVLERGAIKQSEQYFNRLSYISFGSLAFVSLIYITIFIHLFKIPRSKKWNRPDVALLYEGIPLLLTNIFILYYIRSDVNGKELYSRYINYGMRKIVISTALVQFTYIFTFERVVKFFSTDLRVILYRSSVVAPVTS